MSNIFTVYIDGNEYIDFDSLKEAIEYVVSGKVFEGRDPDYVTADSVTEYTQNLDFIKEHSVNVEFKKDIDRNINNN